MSQGTYYRLIVPKLNEALKNADKASESGNLSYFVAALRDTAGKAEAVARTAASLAYLLERHGVQPGQEVR